MWLFSKYGFYSITRTQNRNEWQVRSRVKKDLQNLIDNIGAIKKSKIIETIDSDYRFRIILDSEQYIDLSAFLIASVDYTNFKNKVTSLDDQKEKGPLYMQIWNIMYSLQERLSFSKDQGWNSYFRKRYGSSIETFEDQEELDYIVSQERRKDRRRSTHY